MKIYNAIEATNSCIRIFAFRNKYDILANRVAEWIFSLIKNGNLGEYIYDNIHVDISNSEKETHLNFNNFKIGAECRGNDIQIDIFLKSDFSKSDYQSFNYVLYEVIRHELEHQDRFILGKNPDDEYVKTYDQLMNDSGLKLEEHSELIAKYILSDSEIDSYVKSIMYVAKKQKRSAIEIIEQVLNRAFFNNNEKLMTDGTKNDRIVSLVEKTRNVLRNKLVEYYPKFKEKWI